MATALDLSDLGNFDPYSDPTTLSLRWKEWLRRPRRKRPAGTDEVENFFATLSEVGEDKDYKKAVEKLNEYFLPKKNVLLETRKFRQLKQITEETIDQYCTRLRQQATIGEFSNSENELKIQLVEGCLSSRVRRKAIQDDLSLANILAYARSLEITDKAVKILEEVFPPRVRLMLYITNKKSRINIINERAQTATSISNPVSYKKSILLPTQECGSRKFT
ncbi:Hypothetical predicted protein [Paramuricea clavata]|uniref:Uncharacterized protein n=1 Tax=Paramuricea clavata TaxID=317549 RepID=A0A6S7J7U0_PARCT|nr:Hypothetical predicted protein [Paramuricea clavata]